jgi:signal transduction histidine kinase
MDPRTLPKVLYIDDTPDSLALVRRILGQDFVVLEASEPLSGIELAIETQPDLILLDVNLPQLSGREAAVRLKTLVPNAILVAFSADTSPGARERALAAGCVGYLTKPLDVDTFADQVKEFLHGKRETLADRERHQQAFQAELVERLEGKVRELTKTAERNAFLNEQNKRLVALLQRRQRLLEAAARVAHTITSILDLEKILPAAVDVICEEYGFYYAGIFLIDPGGAWAELHAGRGAAGQAMLAEGHRLAISGESMIGAAIRERAARIARDVGEEKTHFKNPHLPATRSEMALPLIVKDAVLGALTVQSTAVDAFSDEDSAALQTLADQVAIAINNARLLRDLSQANRELLRTKTFEAIATATGETIHWVGNKAAPIPSSARRVRDDLNQLAAALKILLDLPPEARPQHPLWAFVRQSFEAAEGQGVDFQTLADELATISPKQLQATGGLESIYEDLAIIEQSATTILNIKEDLIGPVRLQHNAEIDLPDLLRQTIFEMGLPDGVVQTDLAAALPPTWGDPRQIGQVFNNLIKNAWEALHGRANPQITVACQLADDPAYLLTEVIDNGPGIPPEILDKIWITFFTTKGDRGGTGLGLSACTAIVTQAGGQIAVESQPGAGARFTVLLPVKEAPGG